MFDSRVCVYFLPVYRRSLKKRLPRNIRTTMSLLKRSR